MWIGQTKEASKCKNNFQAFIRWREAILEKYGEDVEIESLEELEKAQ